MLFRQSLRFNGYWLALFSWVILTLAIPTANAFSQSDTGWVRLCSAQGVQWIENSEQSSQVDMKQCPCLSLAIVTAVVFIASAQVPVSQALIEPESFQLGILRYALPQPRSPPIAL